MITEDLEAIKSFVIEGLDLNVADYDGWTALRWASYNGYSEIVEL